MFLTGIKVSVVRLNSNFIVVNRAEAEERKAVLKAAF